MAENTGPDAEGSGLASYGMSQGGRLAVTGLIALSANATGTAASSSGSGSGAGNDADTGPKRMFNTGAFG